MKLRCVEQKWEQCTEIIRGLTHENQYISPYCYEYFLTAIKNRPNIHARRTFRKCRFRCFVIFGGEKPVMVAPLFEENKRRRLYLMGEFSSVGHADFIYDKTMSKENFVACIKMLAEFFPGYTLCLNQVSQFSLTAQAMLEMQQSPTQKDICVKIDISDYEGWYSNLSKSCRQNIRTSYNRVKTDECALEFYLHVNEKPEKKLRKDNIRLFSKRILEHSKLSSFLQLPMQFFKAREAMTKALLNSPDIIFASVYLGGTLAATLNGVIANDGRAIITRLSIESDLKKYSPGGLLLNELIKACCEKYPQIRSIDLSRGDEPYKYTYGGTEHYNYSYELSL